MASPFVPFSGGDFLPPAPTSGGVADDGPPPCSRCGFGGCDLRVAGCGCLLHTVSTPVMFFFSPRRNWYKSYVLLFFRRMKTTNKRTAHLDMAAAPDPPTLAASLQMRGMRISLFVGAAVCLGSSVDVSCTPRGSRAHDLFHLRTFETDIDLSPPLHRDVARFSTRALSSNAPPADRRSPGCSFFP